MIDEIIDKYIESCSRMAMWSAWEVKCMLEELRGELNVGKED